MKAVTLQAREDRSAGRVSLWCPTTVSTTKAPHPFFSSNTPLGMTIKRGDTCVCTFGVTSREPHNHTLTLQPRTPFFCFQNSRPFLLSVRFADPRNPWILLLLLFAVLFLFAAAAAAAAPVIRCCCCCGGGNGNDDVVVVILLISSANDVALLIIVVPHDPAGEAQEFAWGAPG